MANEYLPILRRAEEKGAVIQRLHNNHHKMILPNGRKIVFSLRGRRRRGLNNFRANLRRAGLVV